MEVIQTKTEIKNGVKYTQHYVNRPIKQGDPQLNIIGASKDGVDVTTEVITYVYNACDLT